MTKEFVPEEIALALREIGFDEPCMSADWYANGKICIEYPEKGITNTEHDKLTKECNDDAAENGEDKIEDGATVPLYQQAFRWFREKHDLQSSNIMFSNGKYDTGITRYQGTQSVWGHGPIYDTYEEAELECLKQLIKIVKEKK